MAALALKLNDDISYVCTDSYVNNNAVDIYLPHVNLTPYSYNILTPIGGAQFIIIQMITQMSETLNGKIVINNTAVSRLNLIDLLSTDQWSSTCFRI